MRINSLPEILLNASLATTALNSTLSTRQAFQNQVFLDVQNAGVNVNFIQVFIDQIADLTGQDITGTGLAINSFVGVEGTLPSQVNCQAYADGAGQLPLGHLLIGGPGASAAIVGSPQTFNGLLCASGQLPEVPFAQVTFTQSNGDQTTVSDVQVVESQNLVLGLRLNPPISDTTQWSISSVSGLDSTNVFCAAYSDRDCQSQVGQGVNGRVSAALNSGVPIQCVQCVRV